MKRSAIKTFLRDNLHLYEGKEIDSTIQLLVEFFIEHQNLKSAVEINEGDCEIFATCLSYFFPDGEVTNNERLTGKTQRWYHAFLYLDGRYYDSESPNGEVDWMNLPCCSLFLEETG